MRQRKRLDKELADYTNDRTSTDAVFALTPVYDPDTGIPDLTRWTATITGPTGTPYETGVFMMDVVIPETYPFKPPNVRFVTPMYHPNIDAFGNICVDILKESWSPIYSLSKVMLAISSLIAEPNPNDALNQSAANLYLTNKPAFDRYVRSTLRKHTDTV